MPRRPVATKRNRRRGGQPRFREQLLGRLVDDPVERLAIDRLAPDLQEHRHGEWRHPLKAAVADPPLDPVQHLAEPAHVGEAGRSVGHGRAQQDVVGLEAAQHVVDQVGIERHLAARLLVAGELAVDQAGDDRDVAEAAPEHRGFRHPGLEIVTQHVLVEQRIEVARRLEAPYRQHVIGGNEPQRPVSRPLHALGQEHAQRLVRVAPLEAIGHEIMVRPAGKRLDEKSLAIRQQRARLLQRQPLAHRIWKFRPSLGVG